MSRLIGILLAILAVVLIAAASIKPSKLTPAASPEKAVQSLFESVKNRDWKRAYDFVSPSSNIDQSTFYRDLNGRDGSLRTYSSLQDFDSKVLRESEQEAIVRAKLTWSTAVGAFYESSDLKVVNENGSWRVVWTTEKQPNLPPQVIPVNYLRWDIIRRGADEDWGAQNVEAPRVRILSMNPLERDGNVIIMGEVVNEDTVPAFISVTATLVSKDGSTLGEESSFDKTSHTLLPKEVSPFRIDFPKVKFDKIKSVRMQPTALLVPASADPVIGVLHQRIEKDANGHTVLRGELINQSGQIVNIPHVLATFYDDSGKVIWVSDGYVDKALPPQTPLPFAVEVRDDLAGQIQNYRVTVNHYTLDRS
jgi:hypothetical protein